MSAGTGVTPPPGPEASGEGVVRHNAGWLSIAVVLVGLTNFLYALVLTWLLPARGYSTYVAAQGLLLVCGTAASASIPWVLTRRLAETQAPDAERRVVAFAVAVTGAQAFVAGILIGLLASRFSDGATAWTSGLAAGAIFAAATVVGYQQGRQRFAWIAVLRTAEVLLKVGSGFLLIRLGAGVAGGVAGFVVGSLAVILFGGPALLRQFRWCTDWVCDRPLWKQTFGLAGIQGAVAILSSLDLVLGNLFHGGAPGLAGYQVSVILSRVPLFLSTAISTVIFVRIVSAREASKSAMRSSTNALLSTALPGTVAILTIPVGIAHVFLPGDYPAEVVSFVPFTAGAGFLIALTNLLTTFFQAEGRHLRCVLLLGTGIVGEIVAIGVGMNVGGVRGLAAGAVAGQLLTFVLIAYQTVRNWGVGALRPGPQVGGVILVSLPLLVLDRLPWIWLCYAVAMCAAVGYLVFFGGSRQPAMAARGQLKALTSRLRSEKSRSDENASEEVGPPRPHAYLLTSHPVSPPWNGADKNLARMLLSADLGIDYTFVGDRVDQTAWQPRHRRQALAFRTDMPVAREKLRIFSSLLRTTTEVDLVHAIVSFRRSALTEQALLLLPLLRHERLVVTCPTGHYLPMRLLNRAAAVVAVSQHTRARLQAAGIQCAVQISPGVDLARFHPAPAAPARAALGLAPGPCLLFAGHFDEGGGFEEVVGLFRRLAARVPTLSLLTAMRVRPGSECRAAELQRWVAQLGLQRRVIELGANADMRLAVQAASVVIFPPRSLGLKMDLPLTLLEALASGRPLVVSPIETLLELDDGSGAVIVDDPASDSTYPHLERLLTDCDYAAIRNWAARSLAERRFDVRRMVAAYAALYGELLGEALSPVTETATLEKGHVLSVS